MIFLAHQVGMGGSPAEAPPVGEGGEAGSLLLIGVGRAIALMPLVKWLIRFISH